MNRLLALPDDRLGAPRGDSNPRCLIRRSEFTLAEQRHLGIRGSGYIRSHSSGIARLRVVGQQWDTAVQGPRPWSAHDQGRSRDRQHERGIFGSLRPRVGPAGCQNSATAS